jgi:hypothetical protein
MFSWVPPQEEIELEVAMLPFFSDFFEAQQSEMPMQPSSEIPNAGYGGVFEHLLAR